MCIRVLIVDDSKFICKRIKEILEAEPDFKVIGMAFNGQEAVDMALRLLPDVITMDVNMPVMDGITAVRRIMGSQPCPILMLSAMTQIGARATLDALSAGAVDFLPKQLEDIDSNREMACHVLRQRVRMVASQARRIMPQNALDRAVISHSDRRSLRSNVYTPNSQVLNALQEKIDLLVVVASTGGPVALQQVVSQLPKDSSFPTVLIQHMPPNFTKSLAERLNQLSHIQVREAQHGDILQAGTALLGAGGMQMLFRASAGRLQVTLTPKQAGELYSPCADMTLNSLVDIFDGQLLVVILTGMGADGREGIRHLKRRGVKVWAQDEASCTVYGMPRAVVEAGLADKVYPLDDIANEFKNLH